MLVLGLAACLSVVVLYGVYHSLTLPKGYTGDLSDVDYRNVSVEKRLPKRTGQSYLIIGMGSVGIQIAQMLLQRGEDGVVGFDVRKVKAVDSLQQKHSHFRFIRGDMTVADDVAKAMKGVDVVYMTAAIIKYAERLSFQYPLSHRVNVDGTATVIEAAIKCDVKKLIQTSTSNVIVYQGMEEFDVSETSTYVTRENAPNHYGPTKVLAEKLVLAANGKKTSSGHTLAAACIRPASLVYGEDDPVFLPAMIRRNLLVVLSPHTVIDHVYAGNVAYGHLLLEEKMTTTPEKVGGEAFFVSEDRPMVEWVFCTLVIEMAKRVGKVDVSLYSFPFYSMYVFAAMVEGFQLITRGKVQLPPDLAMLTPATMNTAACTYTCSMDKARNLLGYRPLYTTEEALQKSFECMMQ